MNKQRTFQLRVELAEHKLERKWSEVQLAVAVRDGIERKSENSALKEKVSALESRIRAAAEETVSRD